MKFSKLFLSLIEPRSQVEDIRRREFILNIFLVAILILISIATVMSGVSAVNTDETSREHGAFSFVLLFLILAFFASLLYASRKGFVRTASYILLGAIFLLASYVAYLWGVDIPSALLLFSLSIVMAGVLIHTRIAFFVTFAVTAFLAIVGPLQENGFLHPDRYWREAAWTIPDTIVAGVIFLIIATVAWLSNREIERSLIRARKSEHELKEERDMLEVRVAERTKELRAAEAEKMAQTYRLVEFGRIAGGLFHDLVNPLSAISLNMQSISNAHKDGKIDALVEDVERAQAAIKHMRDLMDSMRKHLAQDSHLERFIVRQVVSDVVRVLEAYARPRQVRLRYDVPEDIVIFGNPTQFTQVMTNLISNAIESFSGHEETREVAITAVGRDGAVEIDVGDTGSGIAPADLERIFEPFFSTKRGEGLGIGLSLTRRIIEKDFGGSLIVTSVLGKGSHFVLRLPI